MMSNIKVAVRVRPLNKREIELGSQNVVDINGDTISVTNLKSSCGVESQPEYGDSRERVKVFTFDYCYDSSNDPGLPGYASQQLVFQDLGTEILEAAFEGYNACVFAYGQTSTGKTYTMMGDPGESGLIPRICEGLFSRVDDFIDENFTFKVDISYLEIYNERVRDLLQSPLLKPSEKYTLKVREHPKEGPYVQDLSRHLIKDNNEIQALIEKANENRTTSSTHMHEHSSRSHAIVTVTFTQARLEDDLPSEIVSKVHLVDLAGSERASTTTTSNYKDRLKEGANINKSLVTLGNVIKCLAERSLMSLSADDADAWSQASSDVLMTSSMVSSRKQRTLYVPYRDSVLTWLLKDSLGGNSKTIMISTISPASVYYNETVSTLRYAQRAKSIINKPKINEDSNVTLIKELRREIERLRDMLVTAQTKPEREPCPDTVVMKGNLVSLQESSTFLSEKLEENEAAAKKLTMHWIEKWQETHDILTTDLMSVDMNYNDEDEIEKPLNKISKMLNPTVKLLLESDLSIRRPLGQRTNSMGVIVDSQQPHLRGMDDDILSTGIVLYYLKEGKTLIGTEGAERDQDIVLSGPSIQPEHCFIQHVNGNVVLHPNRGATCTINGIEIKQPTKLSQGDTILIGKTHLFRFNNPAEAARLREFRKSIAKNETENGSPLGSMDSVVASESGSSSQNCASPSSMTNSFSSELDRTNKNSKLNTKQAKQELQLVAEQLRKVSNLYKSQEEEMWQIQEKQKQEEEDLKKKFNEVLTNADKRRLQAEKEIAKAKAKMEKETSLFKKALEKELSLAKERRKLSPGPSNISDVDKIKKQLEEELNQKSSLQETKKAVEQRVHEMQKLCQKSKLEVSEHEKKIEHLRNEHETFRRQKKQDFAAMLDHIQILKQQKEDLERFLDDKKNLQKVAHDKPVPLRGACSEETVCFETLRSLSFTEVKDMKDDRCRRGSEGDLPLLSNRITMSTAPVLSPSLIEEPLECSSSLSKGLYNFPDYSRLDKDGLQHKKKPPDSKYGVATNRAERLESQPSARSELGRPCLEIDKKARSGKAIEDLSCVQREEEPDTNVVLVEDDRMSNYSQDSLDRMEEEEQFNVSPETEATSSTINNQSSLDNAKHLRKSVSPSRHSSIPVAKSSPSPIQKLNKKSSSPKPNSASVGTNITKDCEFFLHNSNSDLPQKDTGCNAEQKSTQSMHVKKIDISKNDSCDQLLSTATSGKKKTDSVPEVTTETCLGTNDSLKCLSNNDGNNTVYYPPKTHERATEELSCKLVSNSQRRNKNQDEKNKDESCSSPRTVPLPASGTCNAEVSSKNRSKSPLSNKKLNSSQISKRPEPLAKTSSSHLLTTSANKESGSRLGRFSSSELVSDEDQNCWKNSQNPTTSPSKSIPRKTGAQVKMVNSFSKTCISPNKDQNTNSETCVLSFSNKQNPLQDNLSNKQSLPLIKDLNHLSPAELKKDSHVKREELNQNQRCKNEPKSKVQTGKDSKTNQEQSSFMKKEFEGNLQPDLKTLSSNQARNSESWCLKMDQSILKGKGQENSFKKESGDCEKILKLEKEHCQNSSRNNSNSVLERKPADLSSCEDFLISKPNKPSSEVHGMIDSLSDYLNLESNEETSNSKYRSSNSCNASQKPFLHNNERDNLMEDSLKVCQRNLAPKDHYSNEKRTLPDQSSFFTPPGSIENKKQFSVVTRDSYSLPKSTPNAQRLKGQNSLGSKGYNSENLTESSDSEIKKLMHVGLESDELSSLSVTGKRETESCRVKKASTSPAVQDSILQNADPYLQNDPGKMSKVGPNTPKGRGILTQANGDVDGLQSSEDGEGRESSVKNDGKNSKKPHQRNKKNLVDNSKNKVSPFSYIVKVNQEETKVFYNVEATDYTISTIRKHYDKNNRVISPGIENDNLTNKSRSCSSPLLDQACFDKRCHDDFGSSCMSDVNPVVEAVKCNRKITSSSPNTKASSLSSPSYSSVSSSLLSSSLSSSSSPPGQCQQSDDIPDQWLQRQKTMAANIPKTENSQKRGDLWLQQEAGVPSQAPLTNKWLGEIPIMKSKDSTSPRIILDQNSKLAPANFWNLACKGNSQRPQNLPLPYTGPELNKQLNHRNFSADPQSKETYREDPIGTWPRFSKPTNIDSLSNTNEYPLNTTRDSFYRKINLPTDHVKNLSNLQPNKQTKILTRCVSDSAISSDLTDIDSSNLSPQPSHLPCWFSMQHISFGCLPEKSNNNHRTCSYQKPGATNNQMSLKASKHQESSPEYIESLLKLKPFPYSRSLSIDGLHQWINSRDKPASSVHNSEPDACGYPRHVDECLSDHHSPLGTQSEVSESDDPSNTGYNREDLHQRNFVREGLDRKREAANSKNKDYELGFQPWFQDDHHSSSLESSSSLSSASPYMVRHKNDGSLMNLSQEEFNNLEQNLPSDISSLVSSFDGCYLDSGKPPRKETDRNSALQMDNAKKSLDFSSDDARVFNQDPRKKTARRPLRLALNKFSSSGELLEADNIEERVLRNLKPSSRQRDWTSTADSDETLYNYYNMPTYPPEGRCKTNRPESESDISDFQGPPQRFRHPRTRNNLRLHHSSNSAINTDLPGDYPTSASSYRSGSPSLSSEAPGDFIEEESLKYISIGIQASQTECSTQTEEVRSSPTDSTIPKHNNILKDSVASNMIPFPFNIPYLMAEASAGTFHTLPALMMETTTLLKNLSKQLTVEPSPAGSSPASIKEENSKHHKCSVTTQTDLGQSRRLPDIISPPPLPPPSCMGSSLYSSTPSSIHYSASYQMDHGNTMYPSQRPHPEINIHQNNFHPNMTINHDVMHTQNYMNPHLTPNPNSNNPYPFPYHPHQPDMNASLRRDMHLPVVNGDMGTLKSNCSMGDFWKGDMCDSFTYIPHHSPMSREEMPSPRQKSFPSFVPSTTRRSPNDQIPSNPNRIPSAQPDANPHPYQNGRMMQSNFEVDNDTNLFNRQFKFNQTSPLPAWNYNKYYHSMKYTSPNSGKKPLNDLINYSEYNLDSTACGVPYQPDWRMSRGEYLPDDQRGPLHKPHEQDLSTSSPDRFQNGMFTPKPRYRSMTMDCCTRSATRPDTLYGTSFHRGNTLPYSSLQCLGANGDNLPPLRDFSPNSHYLSTPKLHQPNPSSKVMSADRSSYAGGDNQPDQYLSEDLNLSLKKSGLTDEYLTLLSKSARSLPRAEPNSVPVTDGQTRDQKTLKILEDASKLLNANSSPSEMPPMKSYPESVTGSGFRGADQFEGTINSASSIDQSQSNELLSVMKINEEYANMIATEPKSTTDAAKNSTSRHKSKSQKRQALHNQFKEWEKEQLNVMDMVNLKYLPVSFTVKYLEKKVNHCIAQTDLLLDSLDDEDPTTTASVVSEANSTSTMDEDVFESSSNNQLSALSADYLHLPSQPGRHRKQRSSSNASLREAGFETSSELSPNSWLQLQSSIPNLLTDDAATDRDVSWAEEMGYSSNEPHHPIDTLTYTKSSVASSVADLSVDNSDHTLSDNEPPSSPGTTLKQDAMTMLEEVSQFRKFYSAEIEKIKNGLTEMDFRVSAHQSSSMSGGNSRSRQYAHHTNQTSSCDKPTRSRSVCPSKSQSEVSNQMLGLKDFVSDPSAHHKYQPSSPLMQRQRSSSTDL